MIELRHINKKMSKIFSITDFSATIPDAMITALIGPNGSGKSTLLNLIAQIIPPDHGELLYIAHDESRPLTKDDVGYVPDRVLLNPKIRMRDFFELITHFRKDFFSRDQLTTALCDFGVEEYMDTRFSELSLGTKKKMFLALVFSGCYPVILLDEPSNGLDTSALIVLKRYVEKSKNNGVSVVITSHILDFVHSVSDQHLFIDSGSLRHVSYRGDDVESIYTSLYMN